MQVILRYKTKVAAFQKADTHRLLLLDNKTGGSDIERQRKTAIYFASLMLYVLLSDVGILWHWHKK